MERTAEIWFVDGIPSRVLWQGRNFSVSDRPTRLEAADLVLHPAITHVPSWVAWRFLATSDDGEALVFDVREAQDGRWRVLHTYA